jgi:hypothetical protein
MKLTNRLSRFMGYQKAAWELSREIELRESTRKGCAECVVKHLSSAAAAARILDGAYALRLSRAPDLGMLRGIGRAVILFGEARSGYPENATLARGVLVQLEEHLTAKGSCEIAAMVRNYRKTPSPENLPVEEKWMPLISLLGNLAEAEDELPTHDPAGRMMIMLLRLHTEVHVHRGELGGLENGILVAAFRFAKIYGIAPEGLE